jgi:flagellar protein FliS
MAAAPQTINPYLRTKILTARPEELRLMLLEGAVKFARQGRDGLAARDYEAVYNGFSRCREILVELLSSIRPDADADLARRVNALYTFIFGQVVQASVEKNLAAADKAIELLEYERETWSMLLERLAAERAAGTAPAATPAAPIDAPKGEPRPSLCVDG